MKAPLCLSMLCTTALLESGVLAQGIDDGSRAEQPTSAQAFARCRDEERRTPARECWARFVVAYRTSATDAELAYAEEHGGVASAAPVAKERADKGAPSDASDARPEMNPGAPGPGLGTAVLHAQVGALVVGAGSRTIEGVSATPSGGAPLSQKDEIAFGFGLDALLHLGANSRVGVSVFYVPTAGSEANGNTATFGSELFVSAGFEWLWRVGRSVRLVPRAEAGAGVLLPGGDLQRVIDARVCDPAHPSSMACRVASGPFGGYAFGLDLGALYGDGAVRPRLDLLLQYVWLETGGADPAGPANMIAPASSFTSTRLWLRGGVEF